MNAATTASPALTPAEASKQLLRAHVCECEPCARALAVADLGEFCVRKLCDEGRTLLGTARRLRHGSPDQTVSA